VAASLIKSFLFLRLFPKNLFIMPSTRRRSSSEEKSPFLPPKTIQKNNRERTTPLTQLRQEIQSCNIPPQDVAWFINEDLGEKFSRGIQTSILDTLQKADFISLILGPLEKYKLETEDAAKKALEKRISIDKEIEQAELRLKEAENEYQRLSSQAENVSRSIQHLNSFSSPQRCQLCKTNYETLILNCNHRMCPDCFEINSSRWEVCRICRNDNHSPTYAPTSPPYAPTSPPYYNPLSHPAKH